MGTNRAALWATVLTALALSACGDSGTDAPPADTTLPTATLVVTGSEPLSGTVEVRAVAADNVKLARVEFYIDFTKVKSESTDRKEGTFSFAWNTRNETDGLHSVQAKVFDAAGNEQETDVKMVRVKNEQDQPYTFTFRNTTYTPISLTVQGHDFSIASAGSVGVTFTAKPSSFSYSASTSGKTNAGGRLGLLMSWSGTISTSDYPGNSTSLGIGSNYFYLVIDDRGSSIVTGIYVNKGLTAETYDNVTWSSRGIYGIGYYRAYTNGNVRIMYGSTYVQGDYGDDYTLPWTADQKLVLITYHGARDAEDPVPGTISGSGSGIDRNTGGVLSPGEPFLEGTASDS